VVEDHDQRCRTMVDGHVWLCESIGPAFPKRSDVVQDVVEGRRRAISASK